MFEENGIGFVGTGRSLTSNDIASFSVCMTRSDEKVMKKYVNDVNDKNNVKLK